MKRLLYELMKSARRTLWALIVAYMVGIHNFFKGDDKTPDDIMITIESNEVQKDDVPRD